MILKICQEVKIIIKDKIKIKNLKQYTERKQVEVNQLIDQKYSRKEKIKGDPLYTRKNLWKENHPIQSLAVINLKNLYENKIWKELEVKVFVELEKAVIFFELFICFKI